MYQADRNSERQVWRAYRQGRSFGLSSGAAYAAALRTFMKLRPGLGGTEALGALKDVLAREPELGLVDCGPTASELGGGAR